VQELDRTRPRSFLARLLDERDGAADCQVLERVPEDAAFLKVHLVSVLCFDVTIPVYGKKPSDTAVRLSDWGLHRPALSSYVILQLAPGDVKGFANRHASVLSFRVGFIGLSGSLHVDVLRRRMKARLVRHDDLFSWNGEIDAHMVTIAGLMMPLCKLDEDTAAHDRAIVRLEFVDACLDLRLQRV
jgi:hypothetical protein